MYVSDTLDRDIHVANAFSFEIQFVLLFVHLYLKKIFVKYSNDLFDNFSP
jgi:hypothetical protein